MPKPWPGKDGEGAVIGVPGAEEATLIGPEMVLKGELVSEENIRLQGRVEGNISTSRLNDRSNRRRAMRTPSSSSTTAIMGRVLLTIMYDRR